MENPKFTYVIHVNAQPEKLWKALTEPEFTRQYWGGQRIQSDWTKGASVKHLEPDGRVNLTGEVLQADPPRLLSYIFQSHAKDGAPRKIATRVTFEISVAFGVTKLAITHDGFQPGSQMFLEISQGWQAILSDLKTLLETGKTLPFTWKNF